MSELPRAAYVDDNPIMAGAFCDFVNWLWSQAGAHEAHCAATGTPPLLMARNAIDDMIDEATGLSAAYAVSFMRWAIETQWGVAGTECVDQ
jgi:hypothetical protein